MNRIINDPDHVVEDAIQGYRLAHPDYYAATDNARVLKYPPAPIAGKVGIVTGGGSGHEPAFLGYVGKNMLDAVAIGEIFHRLRRGFSRRFQGGGQRCGRRLPVRQLRRRQHERQDGDQEGHGGRHTGENRGGQR